MEFQKLDFENHTPNNMIKHSENFLKMIGTRRTVRDFSNKPIPMRVVENAIRVAARAPSGANKQPWHFVIVKGSSTKKKIRIAAEKEEKEFYNHRAPDYWLEDLNQFKTDWNKPFLEKPLSLTLQFPWISIL